MESRSCLNSGLFQPLARKSWVRIFHSSLKKQEYKAKCVEGENNILKFTYLIALILNQHRSTKTRLKQAQPSRHGRAILDKVE